MRKITFIYLMCCLVFSSTLYAQELTVSGKVTSATDGSAVPGVTVTVEGSTMNTSTNATGDYTIRIPRTGSVLVFSLLGMETQRVTVSRQGPVNVTMSSTVSTLDEVVVVGYGTQLKSVVTGAISSVKASDLESLPINRIEQALQGRTSGLTIAAASGQPGASSTVRLRGFTSFGGSTDKNNPLWVVDGVLVDNGGIGYLNQSDIESIEVLKDAASAAIYGTRAAAGVILVTTKKGKAGSVSINYNGFYGTSAPAKKLDLLNATQYATLRNQSAIAGGVAAPYATPASFGVGTDWQSLIFNNDARRQNHEFSLSGGGEKSTFYASFGYTAQDGIVTTAISKWNRANVRLNSTHRIRPWLTIGQNLGYSHSVSSGVGDTNREFGGPLSSAINLDPITPAIITDPTVAATYPASAVKNANGLYYSMIGGGFQEMTNPLGYTQVRLGNYNWDHNIIGNVFADVEPIKGLHVRSTLGSKLAFYGNDAFTPIYTLSATSANTRSQFYREMNYSIYYNLENTASYTRSFGKHNATLLVGQGLYSDGYSRNVNTRFYDIPATDFESATLRFKTLAANRTTDGSEGTDHKITSLFSRLNYSYDEKYLASALIRRDGSSRFGPTHKFGYFPSFSVGWVPTRESFFPKNKVIDFMKIRGSYGVTGNDGIGDFAYVPLVSSSARSYTFGNLNNINLGYSPAAAANPDLKWEETSQIDVGIDANLFRYFNVTVDWYKKETTGILQTAPVPGYVGSGNSPANIGSMQNTGFEFELGYHNTFGKLNFGVSGNASLLKNKVTKLSPSITFIDDNNASFQTLGNINRTQIGRAYNEFFGYQNLGIFQSQAEIDAYVGPKGTKLQGTAKPGDIKFANLNNDEVIDVNDRDFLGSPFPKVTYGATLNLGYMNFDMVVFGNGAGGNKIFQGLRRLDIPLANYQTKILDSWTATNPSTTMPRIVDGDPNKNYSRFSSIYLENGNYFRIRTIQLGYTLPSAALRRTGLQKLRLYLTAENLFTITKYSGYDPELGPNSSGAVFSIDRGVYPQARSFMAGLNVGF